MLTNLPAHLSASFILTPDRRHIRFDDYDNLESKYNRWLLAMIAPPLYCYLLEHLLRKHGDNEQWWPGNTLQTDNITGILVDSFYKKYLPMSRRLICPSFFGKNIHLAPSKAVMLGAEPPSITKILSFLPNPRFIRLPEIVHDRSLGSIQCVEPSIVQDEVRRNTDAIIMMFDDGRLDYEDIQCLLDYLLEDTKIDLNGLPLLPLATGQLICLQPEKAAKMRYVWKPSDPDRTLFDPSQLIHPSFDVSVLVRKGSYNVQELNTAAAIDTLVREHITPTERLNGVRSEKAAWIENFWAEMPSFKEKPNISNLPLVPTAGTPGRYVSIAACSTNPSVIVTSTFDPEWLRKCLEKLGASVVYRDAKEHSQALKEQLQSCPPLSFERFLKFVATISSHIDSAFLELDKDTHIQFAGWARPQITSVQNIQFPQAKVLPIWPIVQKADLGITLK
jgi:sacsin